MGTKHEDNCVPCGYPLKSKHIREDSQSEEAHVSQDFLQPPQGLLNGPKYKVVKGATVEDMHRLSKRKAPHLDTATPANGVNQC